DVVEGPLVPMSAPPPPNAGRDVYMVPRKGAPPYLVPGLATAVLAYLAMTRWLAWGYLPELVLMGVALLGATLGRRPRWNQCAGPGCESRIPEGATQCPVCGGRIAGTIARVADRLEAEERDHQQ